MKPEKGAVGLIVIIILSTILGALIGVTATTGQQSDADETPWLFDEVKYTIPVQNDAANESFTLYVIENGDMILLPDQGITYDVGGQIAYLPEWVVGGYGPLGGE